MVFQGIPSNIAHVTFFLMDPSVKYRQYKVTAGKYINKSATSTERQFKPQSAEYKTEKTKPVSRMYSITLLYLSLS